MPNVSRVLTTAWLGLWIAPTLALYGIGQDKTLSDRSVNSSLSNEDDGLEAIPDPSPDELAKWIRDLSSDNYAQRRLAVLRLQSKPVAVLPEAIRTLKSTEAVGDAVESLIQLLAVFAAKPKTENGALAYRTLEELAVGRTSSKAMYAQRALHNIALEQKEFAITRLQEMRIDIKTRGFQILTTVDKPKLNAMVIGDSFSGDPEELECMKWITNVFFVRLEGPKINRRILEKVILLPNLSELQIVRTNLSHEDIAVLERGPDLRLLEIRYTPLDDRVVDVIGRLPAWNDVHLFGVNISPEGKAKIKEKLDGANVFISKGGFLGVSCDPFGLTIQSVENNGPAAQAGIRRGDKLLKINGADIYVFEDLRKQLANHSPGETIVVEFETTRMNMFEDHAIVTVTLGENTK